MESSATSAGSPTPVPQPASPAGSASALPGVVATVVVGPPSPDLEVTLAGLAAQDYPALQVLVLVTNDDDVSSIAERVKSVLPQAHVRGVGRDVGFGVAANQVLKLVEGDGGFFLLMHDDVVLEPTAVRMLVEEMFRSNAGLAGPKLMNWDEPRVLSSVGFDVDRFGELDDGLEAHEIDQEQHDAVRDVFALSSACLLVRADLFRRLDGFESSIDFHGENLDLCWRAHLAGARVLVVPAAVARHHRQFADRRPDLVSDHQAETNRISTVLSLTGAARLPLVIVGMVVLSIASAAVALVRGRPRIAGGRLLAPLLALGDVVSILRRRRAVRPIREVPDREVADLQVSGSVRWGRFVRHRQTIDSVESTPSVDRTPLALAVWGVLLVLLLLGARRIIADGVRPIGEMLHVPDSPVDLIRSYLSGWWDRGLGATTAQPTGLVLLGLTGIIGLGQMGFVQTFGILALIVGGWLGMARLGGITSNQRARLVAVVVYAAIPLPYAAVASGRPASLIAYAVLPWVLHLGLRFSGLGSLVVDDADREPVEHPSTAQRVVLIAKLTALIALTAAFAPSAAVVALVALVVFSIVGPLAGGSWRTAGLGVASAVVAFTGAVVLNLPWSLRWIDADGWVSVAGAKSLVESGRGLSGLLRFDIGPSTLGFLVVAGYVPVVISILVARRWRFAWALRGAVLVSAFLLLAVVSDLRDAPVRLPEAGVLLAPVAVGISLGCLALVMSFERDVRGGGFGLRQPLGLLGLLALPAVAFPAVAVAVDGGWNQPRVSLVAQIAELLPEGATEGGYRVLYLGDPAIVPGADREVADGVAYNVVNGGSLEIADTWSSPSATEQRGMDEAVDALARRTTIRVGRLVAPLGVRYFVVPIVDRVRSEAEAPAAVPAGLIDSLGEQLDLRAVYSPASMVVYENLQWIPTTSILSPPAASSREEGGASSLIAAELGGSRPVMSGFSAWTTTAQQIDGGVLNLGVPFDRRWQVTVDGRPTPAEGSFGSVMAFDLGSGGDVVLEYDAPWSRIGWVVLQAALWIALLLAVVQPRRLSRVVEPTDTVIVLEPEMTPTSSTGDAS